LSQERKSETYTPWKRGEKERGNGVPIAEGGDVLHAGFGFIKIEQIRLEIAVKPSIRAQAKRGD